MRGLALVGSSLLLQVSLRVAAAATRSSGTVTVERGASAAPTATGDQRLYGRITSLVRRGDHFELRFDPAWFLSALTANVAQARTRAFRAVPTSVLLSRTTTTSSTRAGGR